MTKPVSIYVGPTLPPEMRPISGQLRYLPPACAGDLLALADGPPHTVLLIDGLFEHARAPWHKEILVLLSRGFDVWGAASIGALRAAELAAYGMFASGPIARAYIDRRIIGDDEVAVAHAPAALGHRALTISQVDVRATLVAAIRAGLLSRRAARDLRSRSRAIFFKERTWPSIVDAAYDCLAIDTHARFAAWLPAGAVAQKQIDALRAIGDACTARPPPVQIAAPPQTSFLDRLEAEVSAMQREGSLRTSANAPDRETAETASAS